jgi:tetratricopeptide (TPR) repeat protein
MAIVALGLASAALALASCEPPNPYISGSTAAERALSAELLDHIGRPDASPESDFAAIQRLAAGYVARREYGKLAAFLAQQARTQPEGPYAGYYLFAAGHAYAAMDSLPMAAIYYHRALRGYPDMVLHGESMHLSCLRQLINIEKDPARRAAYYREALARFSGQVDAGAMYFMLGQAYEELGDWDLAIQAYKAVVPYPGTSIPGFPGAYQYASKSVDFANSSKDWTFESLDSLVAAVRAGIAARDARQLSRLRAKVNFFAMSWAQEESDENSQVEFDLGAFMGEGPIACAPGLDPGSNSREAYLRTTGWTDRVPVWYLYFRKIDFPANPDIHGRWEWAGIYFGDKLR